MGDSVTIYTTAAMDEAELHAVVVELGGAIIEGTAVVEEADAALWPFVGSIPSEEDDPEKLAALAKVLGGPIRSYVVLELSSRPGSQALAGRFLERLVSRHPCIVDASSCCLRWFTPEEASALLRDGRSVYQRCPVHGSVFDWGGLTRRRWWQW